MKFRIYFTQTIILVVTVCILQIQREINQRRKFRLQLLGMMIQMAIITPHTELPEICCKNGKSAYHHLLLGRHLFSHCSTCSVCCSANHWIWNNQTMQFCLHKHSVFPTYGILVCQRTDFSREKRKAEDITRYRKQTNVIHIIHTHIRILFAW